jgi:hypothetical protein
MSPFAAVFDALPFSAVFETLQPFAAVFDARAMLCMMYAVAGCDGWLELAMFVWD